MLTLSTRSNFCSFTTLSAIVSVLIGSSLCTAADAQLTTVEYKRVGDEVLLLDVGVPAADPDGKGRPVVVAVHGGGWSGGSRKTDFPGVLQALSAAGYVYVSMDYRLSPKHAWPACRDDVEDAVTWTKTNIQKYGGDPDRIAVMGYSAGGQLAFWAAIRDKPPHKLKALVGLAPATDLLEDLGRRGGPSPGMRAFLGCEENEGFGRTLLRFWEASPINYLHAGLPPILLIHGTADRTVPFQQSFHIQRKLAESKSGVPCEIYPLENAPHRQTEWDKFDTAYKTKLLEWLEARLAKPPMLND